MQPEDIKAIPQENGQPSKSSNKFAGILRPQSPRRWVQLGVLALTLGIGAQFYIFLNQAMSTGLITVPRPPGVEGFLPIGALMGFKLWATTGVWDPVHPAAMVILGFAFLISLVARKSFCGWFCPVGTVSEWLSALGMRIFGRQFTPPKWLHYPLSGLKYLVLGFFIWVIAGMSAQGIMAFMASPYYIASDVKMLHFFTRMTALTFWVLLALVGLTLVVKNFWCRYLCPYGALLGLIALVSPARIERRADTCTNCGQCEKTCPGDIAVQKRQKVLSPECVGCMDCVKVCPVPGTLYMRSGPWQGLNWRIGALGVTVIGVFLVMVYLATMSGHWYSHVPLERLRMVLPLMDQLAHP